MNIVVNSKPTVTESSTLQQLAEEMQLPAKGVAVAVNNRMIPRTAWAETTISEGVSVVIIKAACGG